MSMHLTIDGRPCEVEKGVTVLQAARANLIDIPTLCDCPGLPSRGSCRMCVVEIQGRANTPTACTAQAEDGMVVLTHSPKVRALRVELLQMLLADHPSSCLFCPEQSHCDECMVTLRKSGVTTGCRSCPKDGQCKLQEMVKEFGLIQADYPGRYRMLKVEKNDPFFDRDYNLCVLCGRCVRTCESLHFSSIINYTKRGSDTVIGTAFGHTHLEAGCTFCGACVEVCPTGALTEKTRKWEGTPERAISTTCPLCSIGCPISLLTKGNAVIGSLPDHAAGRDYLCVLGRFGITELVNGPTRMKRPEITSNHRRVGVSWDHIIERSAQQLSACQPDQFEMVVSSNLSNESLYVAQKFCRSVMHSEAIHSPALDVYAGKLDEVSKLMRQSQPLSALADATTIVCLGFDGTYSQSVVEVELHRAKQRGARIITINPQRHSPGQFADIWLRPFPGKETDLLETLVERVQAGQVERNSAKDTAEDRKLRRVVRDLRDAKNPIFIIGQAFLGYHGRRLLTAIHRLVELCGGQVITLAADGNLVGMLALGILSKTTPAGSQPHTLYIVGEAIPNSTPENAFILYQNLYPPQLDLKADLLLPAAAFSEEDGSVIDSSGCVREMRQVVNPPGEALPSWKILCKIAQKMGASGFEYENVAEIRKEIAKEIENFGIDRRVSWSKIFQGEPVEEVPGDRSDIPIYMGYPLADRIAGLNSLYRRDQNV